MLVNEVGVVGVHEIGHRRPSRRRASPTPTSVVNRSLHEHDAIAMHGHGLVQAAEEADERTLALADQQFLHRHLLEQTVCAVGERDR